MQDFDRLYTDWINRKTFQRSRMIWVCASIMFLSLFIHFGVFILSVIGTGTYILIYQRQTKSLENTLISLNKDRFHTSNDEHLSHLRPKARKKIDELTVEDFPGLELNNDLFKLWQEKRSRAKKNRFIFAAIVLLLIIIFIIPNLMAGIDMRLGMIPSLIIWYIQDRIEKPAKDLQKELQLTNKMIRNARKGCFNI